MLFFSLYKYFLGGAPQKGIAPPEKNKYKMLKAYYTFLRQAYKGY